MYILYIVKQTKLTCLMYNIFDVTKIRRVFFSFSWFDIILFVNNTIEIVKYFLFVLQLIIAKFIKTILL